MALKLPHCGFTTCVVSNYIHYDIKIQKRKGLQSEAKPTISLAYLEVTLGRAGNQGEIKTVSLTVQR